jgi:hypothetical protein
MAMLENLKLSDFAAHLNSKFRMALAGSPVLKFELIEVRKGIESVTQESFTLVFRAPASAPRVSQMFNLDHDELGTLSLFLSPFKLVGNDLFYEAVFNRLLKK